VFPRSLASGQRDGHDTRETETETQRSGLGTGRSRKREKKREIGGKFSERER
jgi:hypothetical protein